MSSAARDANPAAERQPFLRIDDVVKDFGGGAIAEHADGEGEDDGSHKVVGAGEGAVFVARHAVELVEELDAFGGAIHSGGSPGWFGPVHRSQTAMITSLAALFNVEARFTL